MCQWWNSCYQGCGHGITTFQLETCEHYGDDAVPCLPFVAGAPQDLLVVIFPHVSTNMKCPYCCWPEGFGPDTSDELLQLFFEERMLETVPDTTRLYPGAVKEERGLLNWSDQFAAYEEGRYNLEDYLWLRDWERFMVTADALVSEDKYNTIRRHRTMAIDLFGNSEDSNWREIRFVIDELVEDFLADISQKIEARQESGKARCQGSLESSSLESSSLESSSLESSSLESSSLESSSLASRLYPCSTADDEPSSSLSPSIPPRPTFSLEDVDDHSGGLEGPNTPWTAQASLEVAREKLNCLRVENGLPSLEKPR